MMKSASSNLFAGRNDRSLPSLYDGRGTVRTRFGESVDVRNRGALRLTRMAGIQVSGKEAPAVVRLWSGDNCRELSINEARALAAQLLEAASYAESQNAC